MTVLDEKLLAEIESLREEVEQLRAILKVENLEKLKAQREVDRKLRAERRELDRLEKKRKAELRRGAPHKYPLPTMDIGQAFFIADARNRYGTLRAICSYWQRRQPGKRFSVLSKRHDGVKGYKVVRWA